MRRTATKEHKEGLAAQGKNAGKTTGLRGARISTIVPLLLTEQFGEEWISVRMISADDCHLAATSREIATPTNSQRDRLRSGEKHAESHTGENKLWLCPNSGSAHFECVFEVQLCHNATQRVSQFKVFSKCTPQMCPAFFGVCTATTLCGLTYPKIHYTPEEKK